MSKHTDTWEETSGNPAILEGSQEKRANRGDLDKGLETREEDQRGKLGGEPTGGNFKRELLHPEIITRRKKQTPLDLVALS